MCAELVVIMMEKKLSVNNRLYDKTDHQLSGNDLFFLLIKKSWSEYDGRIGSI